LNILFQTITFRQVQRSANLDDLDRRIVAALQVNSRAPYGVIAAVLDEQERTVARRADRLLESGVVRPSVFVDELRTGIGQPVSLRISVEPGQLDEVAQQLCARADTCAVLGVTGASDLGCELVARDQPTLHAVLSSELPGIAGIRSTRTYAVLRHVKPTAHWRLPLLSAEQEKQLEPSETEAAPDAGPVELQDTDRALIGALRTNARASFTELGDQLGVTATTVRRWLDRLLATGAISLRSVVEPADLGLAIEAEMWLNVRPESIEAVSRRLAARPEVTYCGVVAGAFAIDLLLALTDLAGLYTFLAEVIGAEHDVRDCEPALVTRAYKRGFVTAR
jgi:DNA-binding Lrp family transcriptional regulator